MYRHTGKSRINAACFLRCRQIRRRNISAIPTYEESDVVIVGGGPAGLALASALASSQIVRETLRITLVEAGDLSRVRGWSLQPSSFSNRVSSITNASQSFLTDIGAWAHVEEERTSPIEEMQVWDGISDARITFSADDSLSALGPPTPGTFGQLARLTENLNLQRALLRYLETTPSVELADNVKVQSIQKENREGDGWPLVHLSDGRVLRTRLLVGADGLNSPVRTYAGIQSYGWAYDTHAIVATLNHHPRTSFQTPNTVAYQRFLPTGPIAFLPLSPTASSMVWSTKPALATALLASDPAVLACMINAAFRLPEVSLRYLHAQILEAHKTGSPLTLQQLKDEIRWRERSHGIDLRSAYSLSEENNNSGVPPEDASALPPAVTSVQPGTAASFPLRNMHADSYIGEGIGARTVLVGDAAHTIHPLAGQGLNMGLGDVESLATCIRETLLRGGDIGSHTALLPYARARYFENHKIMSACDKLHKLYASTSDPVVWARSVGVEVLNELDTVKAALMMSAGSRRLSMLPSGRVIGANLAATGIENIARTVSQVKTLSEGVAGMVGAGIQGLLQQVANSQRH